MPKRHNITFGVGGSNLLTRTVMVGGYENTVHYYERSESEMYGDEYVCFFPGDIQLRQEQFFKYFENDYPFQEGNDQDGDPSILEVYYERVVDVLLEKFSQCKAVVIVQPSKLDLGNFMYEYENFYVKDNANFQLIGILRELFPQEMFGCGSTKHHINLVAFSKGCVALNSMICEVANYFQFRKSQNHDVKEYQTNYHYVHWDEPNPKSIVPKCYKIALSPNTNSNLTKKQMKDAIQFFQNNVNSIHYLDCHRFITTESILTWFSDMLQQSNLYLKVHQTPLIHEKNPYRKHIIVESDGFMKIMRKHSKSSVHYQYYYKELENKVDPFVLHFRVVKDFEA